MLIAQFYSNKWIIVIDMLRNKSTIAHTWATQRESPKMLRWFCNLISLGSFEDEFTVDSMRGELTLMSFRSDD